MKLDFSNGKYCGSKKSWGDTVKKVLERAQLKCEFCGVERYSVGRRKSNGDFMPLVSRKTNKPISYKTFKEAKYSERCWNYIYKEDALKKWHKFTKVFFVIVLTVAHIDHDATNNETDNLKSLCQKCHINHDEIQHKENRRLTVKKKKKQVELWTS